MPHLMRPQNGKYQQPKKLTTPATGQQRKNKIPTNCHQDCPLTGSKRSQSNNLQFTPMLFMIPTLKSLNQTDSLDTLTSAVFWGHQKLCHNFENTYLSSICIKIIPSSLVDFSVKTSLKRKISAFLL